MILSTIIGVIDALWYETLVAIAVKSIWIEMFFVILYVISYIVYNIVYLIALGNTLKALKRSA